MPETIRVEVLGEARPGVLISDVADHLIRQIGPGIADYRAVEFLGRYIERFNVDLRIVLCNRTVEVGAMVAVVPPDALSVADSKARRWSGSKRFVSGPNAHFAAGIRIDLSELEPQVAVPSSSDDVHPLSSVAGRRITQAVIQGCSSGTFDELEQAAGALRGRQVASGARPGDVILAGRRSCTAKPHLLGWIGMRASGLGVVCRSVTRRAIRNAVSAGACYLASDTPLAHVAREGQGIPADLESGIVELDSGERFEYEPPSPLLRGIIALGGTKDCTRHQFMAERDAVGTRPTWRGEEWRWQ